MKFIYGRQDMTTLETAQANCFLLTNGLGGYASLSAAFSMTRSDQGMLVCARTAPNDRVTLVARIGEMLTVGNEEYRLSTQQFADGAAPEEGYRLLSCLTVDELPVWAYDVRGVRVRREAAMAYERNVSVLRYTVENRTAQPCVLRVRPYVLGFEKGHAPLKPWKVSFCDGYICANGQKIYLKTNGLMREEALRFEMAAYMHDAPDGRPEKGLIASVCSAEIKVEPGETRTMDFVMSQKPCTDDAQEIMKQQKRRIQALRRASGLQDSVALALVQAADAYIAQRASTGGKTILAGYPFFGDWGRDTMIALMGCTLSTGRSEDAKSILRTFLKYEKDGLVPNLFPEGEQEPLYNTVDAALLLIVCVYHYVKRSGDTAFAAEAWPVMEDIVRAYRKGTHFGIRMDEDGLIMAGQGFDQVTWMDVRIGEILPTPRHGKPVEINAYWYSALRIMEETAAVLGLDGSEYASLAKCVRKSFAAAFWMEEKGCLRDVISGTAADEQIRCNQIWAVTMPFPILEPWQERHVVDTVYAHLYTPCGLRTLSPQDSQFHPVYAGVQKERDMAYHQGTTWVFPLGAYYLAYLKTRGYTAEAARDVREALEPMAAALKEGCIGQLPEIYDGGVPGHSRGCFAQAWSVGEMLRVYEALEEIERAHRQADCD